MLRTLMRGESEIYGRRVIDAAAKKTKCPETGKYKKASLRLAHWLAVVRAGMEQHRIGEVVHAAGDKLGPKLVLHLPAREDEVACREYHNRCMQLCNVTLAGLTERILAVSSKKSQKLKEVKEEEGDPVVGGEAVSSDQADPPQKRLRLSSAALGANVC